MKRYFIGTLLGFFVCLSAKSQEATVNALLTPAEILIGDEVTLTIQLTYPPDWKLNTVETVLLQELDSIEVKNIAIADTASRSPMVNVEQKIILTSFDEGLYKIPPIPIQFFHKDKPVNYSTPQLQLVVNTIPISPGDSINLQPIKDIIQEPLKLQDILPYTLVLAGLLAIGLLVWFFKNRKQSQPEKEGMPIPTLAPHELANQRIAALQAERYLEKEAFKVFHTQISYILREYLEGRYGISALETTTFELLRQLQQAALPEGWFEPLRQILHNADMVKFARAELPLTAHESALKQLATFVNASTPEQQSDTDEEE